MPEVAGLQPGIRPFLLALHLRCWKTGTPHRAGKQASEPPGVLGHTKRSEMLSVGLPTPRLWVTRSSAADDGRRAGGRAGGLRGYLKDPDWKRKGNR